MHADDLREDISQLEIRIEELAKRIEECRKIILMSKIAMSIGALLIVALVVGAISFTPTTLLGAIIAVIGGIVGFGSNTSTLNQMTIEMKASEALRTELIERIDLRVVG